VHVWLPRSCAESPSNTPLLYSNNDISHLENREEKDSSLLVLMIGDNMEVMTEMKHSLA
jgi:hypothetical protein